MANLAFVNFSGGGQQAGPFASATTASQSVTGGNSLVVASRWPASSISDTAGNNYIPLPFLVWNNGNLGEGQQWWYCNNCAGKSNLQVTATFKGVSFGVDTYTVIGCWQFSGGTLLFDQHISNQSGSSSTTQTVTYTPRYQQSLVCMVSFVNNLSTFSVTAPLVQDGGTSVAGNQIGAAEHVIFNSGAVSQTLQTNSSASAAWFIGGPTFQVLPPHISAAQIRRIIQESALFTGREYGYYITLEKLWPLS